MPPAVLPRPGVALSWLKSSTILRNSAVYLSASVAAGALGYVFHFEAGRLLGPERYAVVASAIAGLSLLTLPAIMLQFVSARYASVLAAEGRAASIRPMLMRLSSFSLLVSIALISLLLVAAKPVGGYMKLSDLRVYYVLLAAALLTVLVAIMRGALQGLQSFFALSGNTVVDMGSRLVFAGLFIILGLGPFGAVAGVLAGTAIAYTQGVLLVGRRTVSSNTAGASGQVQGIGAYALLASFAGVGVNFLFSIDTVLAKHFLSPESAGIYAAAGVLARVVFFLGLSVAGVMFPEVASRHARDQEHLHVVNLSLLLVGGMGIVLVAIYATLPGLVLLPYGPRFNSVRPYLGPFAAALTMLAVANLLITYFLSIARNTFILPLVAACVVETVLISIFHGDIWQILEMVMGTLVFLSGSLATLYWVEHLRVRRLAAGTAAQVHQ